MGLTQPSSQQLHLTRIAFRVPSGVHGASPPAELLNLTSKWSVRQVLAPRSPFVVARFSARWAAIGRRALKDSVGEFAATEIPSPPAPPMAAARPANRRLATPPGRPRSGPWWRYVDRRPSSASPMAHCVGTPVAAGWKACPTVFANTVLKRATTNQAPWSCRTHHQPHVTGLGVEALDRPREGGLRDRREGDACLRHRLVDRQ